MERGRYTSSRLCSPASPYVMLAIRSTSRRSDRERGEEDARPWQTLSWCDDAEPVAQRSLDRRSGAQPARDDDDDSERRRSRDADCHPTQRRVDVTLEEHQDSGEAEKGEHQEGQLVRHDAEEPCGVRRRPRSSNGSDRAQDAERNEHDRDEVSDGHGDGYRGRAASQCPRALPRQCRFGSVRSRNSVFVIMSPNSSISFCTSGGISCFSPARASASLVK